MTAQCRLCQNTKLLPRFQVRNYWLDECGCCGFVQVRELPNIATLQKIYSKDYFVPAKYANQFVQHKENSRRLDFMRRQGIQNRMRILEVGCATGGFLKVASDSFEMWGIDFSADAIHLAREENPSMADRIYSGPIEGDEFPEDFFDGIVFWDVLEHLPQPAVVCERLRKSLKVGGRLFFSTPDIGSWMARILRTNWIFLTVPEHLGFFSRRSIKYLFETELSLSLKVCKAKGKWTSLSFLFHKLKKKYAKGYQPSKGNDRQNKSWQDWAVYIPTGDILYGVVQKP